MGALTKHIFNNIDVGLLCNGLVNWRRITHLYRKGWLMLSSCLLLLNLMYFGDGSIASWHYWAVYDPMDAYVL